ncbi:MAG: OmpA family protein [Desulfobacteraceae bacterium]|nr:OmpA family protein [Desulfobacteraceae bacterium]
MARKRVRASHLNHERWMVSYADFITLLFAVFVVMYAISQLDSQKRANLLGSMQKAFSAGILPPGSPTVALSSGTSSEVEKQVAGADKPALDLDMQTLKGIESTIIENLRSKDALDQVSIFEDQRGLVISMAEAGFFDSGKAEMRNSSLKVLDAIAPSLLSFPNPIRIEGHTDNIPIHNERFSSNWELSSARASFVIDYLLRHFALSPGKLSVAGYGQYHPIADNGTSEGRARNRRVDIVMLKTSAPEAPQASASAAAPLH